VGEPVDDSKSFLAAWGLPYFLPDRLLLDSWLWQRARPVPWWLGEIRKRRQVWIRRSKWNGCDSSPVWWRDALPGRACQGLFRVRGQVCWSWLWTPPFFRRQMAFGRQERADSQITVVKFRLLSSRRCTFNSSPTLSRCEIRNQRTCSLYALATLAIGQSFLASTAHAAVDRQDFPSCGQAYRVFQRNPKRPMGTKAQSVYRNHLLPATSARHTGNREILKMVRLGTVFLTVHPHSFWSYSSLGLCDEMKGIAGLLCRTLAVELLLPGT